MENLINLVKTHKKAIIIPSVLLVIIAIIALFTTICLKHFENINKNSLAEINESELSGSIAVSSDDAIPLDSTETDEYPEETEVPISLEDEEKDKEEEKKAEEEEKKAQEEEKKKLEKEKNDNKNKNSTSTTNKTTDTSPSYYIKVNKSANTVTVYTKDANGNYTVPCKAMVCSTGYASPNSGVYSSKKLGTWHTLFGRSIWAILYTNNRKYFIPFCSISF